MNQITISSSGTQSAAYIDTDLLLRVLRIGNDANAGAAFNTIAQGNGTAPGTLAGAVSLADFNQLLANLRAMKILA